MLEALSSAGSAHSGTDLFNLAERRLNWLETRQATLAGNIANANTPGYVAKDNAPFQGVLQNQLTMMLAETEPGHLPGHTDTVRAGRDAGSTSPDGNGVVLEDEVEKVADTNDDQRFATTVYTRYMSMFETVLGTGS